VCILHGGGDGTQSLSDTWEWDGALWTRLDISGPNLAPNRRMAFDSHRGVVVMSGQSPSNSFGSRETWTLGPPCDFVSPVSQPVPITSIPGATAVLSVTVSGSPVSFRWRRNGVDIADDGRVRGAASASLTVTALQSSDIGNYDCIVRSDCNTLQTQSVSVECRPRILSVPIGPRLDQPISLYVEVAPGPDLGFQWQFNGVDLVDTPGRYAGARSRQLSLLSADASLLGLYRVVVSNACGVVTSGDIYVRSPCPTSDYNQDGNLDQDDIEGWIGCAFGSAGCDLDPDFNQDGNIDQDDLAALIHVIAGGPCL
jgi:hypothetical protein